MNFQYVGMDVETNGLNPLVNEILEIAAVECDEYGQIGRKLHFFCKPSCGYVSDAITKINGITWEQVKNEKSYLSDGIREQIAEFIGERAVVGHNIISFDLNFIKIRPKKAEDTLLMCREKYGQGKNNLKVACKRENIEWDDNEAHGALYDTLKCIELFSKLKVKTDKMQSRLSMPLFEQSVESMGITTTADERKLIATQAYSFSRISLFNQCPFKWYMQYIKKERGVEPEYFITGGACHRVAEWSGSWCYKQTFINKFEAFSKQIKIPEGITARIYGERLFDNPKMVRTDFNMSLSSLISKIDSTIPADSYESPSMPDWDTYNKFIAAALMEKRCNVPSVIEDVHYIMEKFHHRYNFSFAPGEILLTEKDLAFDRSWKVIDDFFSSNVFFRGKIDVIGYLNRSVSIIDYKTSRKMLSAHELKNDMQLKIYAFLVYKFLPPDSFDKMFVEINYIRFGKAIRIEIEDIKQNAMDVEKWIMDNVSNIENEMMKKDGESFKPIRNEYCGNCFLGEDGKCPLFNKQIVGKIDDPMNFIVNDAESCRNAWKRVEANKAENSRLTKLCKAFIESTEEVVTIDDNAKLGFFATETRGFKTVETMKFFLERNIPIDKILSYFSAPSSKVNKAFEVFKLVPTIEELDQMSSVDVTQKFEALTKEEAEDKKCM